MYIDISVFIAVALTEFQLSITFGRFVWSINNRINKINVYDFGFKKKKPYITITYVVIACVCTE